MNRLRKLICGAVLATGLLAGVAQAGNDINYDERGYPVNVPKLELQRPYKAWLLVGLFLVLALGVTFKSSKRTHLD